jgi:hypothetical protein
MTDRPTNWPKDVDPITIEELDKLGRNSDNELFWDGRRLITRSRLQFTIPQTLLAILAVIASLATSATGLNNASVFLRGRNIAWLGCPVTATALPAPVVVPSRPPTESPPQK